jgi:hypothetical protein
MSDALKIINRNVFLYMSTCKSTTTMYATTSSCFIISVSTIQCDGMLLQDLI